jgi:hypothetical protein
LRGANRPWRRILRKVEDLPVGEPSELRRELVALAQGRRDRHCKSVFESTRDLAFETAKMVNIGDNTLAGLTGHGSLKRHATRGHVDNLTGEFAPVLPACSGPSKLTFTR